MSWIKALINKQGLAAARPTSGMAGQTYFATDTGELSTWDGNSWELLSSEGTIPDGSVGVAKLDFDVATQTELTTHTSDATAAHAASAISVADAGGDLTATDVEAALAELVALIEAVEGGAVFEGDAGDVPFTPAGAIAAEDVQAAIEELDSEKQTAAQVATAIAAATVTVVIQVSDMTTALTTGNDKARFTVPASLNNKNLTSAAAAVVGAPAGGPVTIMIRNATQTADMLSTPITIDASEFHSKDAVAAVVDTGNDDVATGDSLRVDIDATGTSCEGLDVILTFA